ncbi:MAG: phosphomannomutase/phosphoglucomutase [Methylicorpusculum sp.]|uniref:phosphomannomutase/phosphoglucomutase n=1 Tax=Methylicorpusculum sp. TaxID=2713644 RepID=UPI00271F169B|nr:phosphomannomutase/phosphoglucomutase [Methylicorpusculum sp.]MDO8844348.1 phosphomannomutase/phosphoglucomutase [Methylicorpusculum sp.]MDO8940691.1 phosphomannomutase/phosphoglucomutase [Methylicorpusculum sp.]MDP2202680.1 phosphomannomutase/phosphoglucomutase [Methylicorpusculum sp.]
MERIFLTLSAIAVILVIVAGGGVFWASSIFINQAKEASSASIGTGAAFGISAQIDQLNSVLVKMAQDPDVIGAIDSKNPDLIRAEEHKLTNLLPSALTIRLLRPGVDQLDTSRIPHMGFADLDMVRETVNAHQMPAVQGDAGPNRHLALTAKVVNDGRVIGIILASLSYDFLNESLKVAPIKDQLIILKQADFELASTGNKSLKGNADKNTVNVANTGWMIEVWYEGGASIGEAGLIFGIVVACCLLILLAFFVSYRKTSDMLSHDQSSVLLAVKDLMTGNAHGNYPVHLTEMSIIISTLVQFKRVMDHHDDPLVQDDNLDIDGFFEQSSFAIEEISFDDVSEPEKEKLATKPKEKPIAMSHEFAIPQTVVPAPVKRGVPDEIFRAYDIRGIVDKTLTKSIVYDLGRALGTEIRNNDCKTAVIARDGRNSSPAFSEELAKGLASTGCDVLDLGMAPTPLLYFVVQHTEGRSGVMITGSHNPADYNGLKMVIQGDTLAAERIQDIKKRMEEEDYKTDTRGEIDQNSMFVSEYIGIISEDIKLERDLKVVLDCGNGVAGDIGPVLLKTLGCDVIELFCDIDGNFPNHHPDPSKPENLRDLIKAVKEHEADLGIAFDGDGDRLGIVDSDGNIIWPDRQMMIFAKDVLSKKPGSEIIFDVKCSKHLADQIVKYGGRPLMWKTGHSFMKAKLKETGAKLAGEMSGHIFFNDRWFGFDDALYSAARMLEIISADSRSSAQIFAEVPNSINTPELMVHMVEGENVNFMNALIAKADLKGCKITQVDGFRADFTDGWGLVRASNTTPSLVLRFEADSQHALKRIQNEFKMLMTRIKPDIVLPF